MAYEKTPLVYLVVLFIVIVLGNDLSVFGFKTDNLGRSLLLGLVYYLVMGFLPLLLMGIGFYAYTGQILVENFDPALFLLIMPFMTLCVGISEEGLFRGYMQTSLDRVYSRRKAILAQSILFGLWHFIWHVSPLNIIGMLGHIVGSFVVGLLFGYFYGIAANLAPLVLAHGLINSVSYGFIENEGAFALIQNLPVTTQLLLFATPYILSLAMTFASTKFLIKTIMPHDTT